MTPTKTRIGRINVTRNRKNIYGTVIFHSEKKESKLLKAIDNGVKSICDYDKITENGDRVWSF